jgi:hypothetical protein
MTTTLDRTDVATRLTQAAAHIAEHGWCRGDWHTPLDGVPSNKSPACAFGAIKIACGGDPDDLTIPAEAEQAAAALCDHLGLTVRDLDCPIEAYGEVIGGWQDTPERTAQQVIDALRAAAEGARVR